MRLLNLNPRLILGLCAAALLCGVPVRGSAQILPTLTPAQQQAKAQALARQQQAQAKAKAKADAAKVAKTTATTASPVPTVQPVSPGAISTKPTNSFFAPPSGGKNAVAPAAATTSAVSPQTGPAKGSFFSNLASGASNNGRGNSAAGGGSSPAAPDTANRSAGNNTFAAGVGRFEYSDTSAVAYGCLRSGTRVFCDFDEFKEHPGQVNAGWAYNGAKLILNGGHIVNAGRATYVDADGETFATAELSPNAAVRMMLEYDDVPETQNSVILSFHNKQIQNVSVSQMNFQENGKLAARGSNTPGSSSPAR